MTAESTKSAEPAERPGGWRLATSRSLYLRGAKEQSIEWYPWGPEPFEIARRTHRPVLLDVGASWCHWCHVMDEGTYSDAEVSRLIGQHFVAVKVDRDEHPEVDRRFQRQVNAISGEGGWPLTAFLTPSGEAFFGGTYFPAQEGLGRPAFRRVLKEIARLWREEPAKVAENTRTLLTALAHEEHGTGRAEPPSTATLLAEVRRSVDASFDPIHGGFGFAPKFPHPTAIAFLLGDSRASGGSGSAERALVALRKMADGGVYDQLGGGFHRYAVDEGWHIPHFEKMGAGNAALLSAYADGYRFSGDERLLEVVRGTADWIRSTLEDPEGGFGASQDADNAPGDDGGYYTWTRAELKAVLEPEELRLVSRFFGVGSEGRMPHDPDRNVLFRLMSVKEAADGGPFAGDSAGDALRRAVEKLREARARRPTPAVDRAVYANLNGAFIRALIQASEALGDPSLLASARKAGDRLLQRAYRPDRGVAHRLESADADAWGRLEDQVELAWGLVELAGAIQEPRYAETAAGLYELIFREFGSDSAPLRDLAPNLYEGPELASLREPSYPVEDQPNLSPNSGAVLGLLRLHALTNAERWRHQAKALLGRMLPRMERAGLFASGAALAAGLLETPPVRVVIEGEGAEAEALERAARLAWHPNRWVFRGVPPPPFSLPEELEAAAGRPARDPARALVCWGTQCAPPVTDPAKVSELLRTGPTPS
jgi:uncharacterized protein YyaL (SSP411 family)